MTAPVVDAPAVGGAGTSDGDVRPDAPAAGRRRFLGGRLSLRVLVTPVLLVVAGAAIWALARSRITDFDRAPVEAIMTWDYLSQRFAEHIKLSAISSVLALVIGLPAGILLTRSGGRRYSAPIVGLANAGQTIPTISVLALVYTFTGLGFRPALIALWIYSILPILQNTVVGLRGVDPDLVDAARGMGMTPSMVLRRVELPLALPVIIAGVRTAVVLNVGTAALATFVGAGGLGQVIDTGVSNLSSPLLYIGAGFTALLALAFDWFVALVGDLLTPPRVR